MKKIILLLLIIMSGTLFLNADLSVKDIDKMISKIHEKRAGIRLKTLDSTKEPFVRLEEKENVISIVIPDKKVIRDDVNLILHSILNGKAYINESWIKVEDDILGYKLKFIGKRGVVLRNENHIKKLFLRKEKNSLIKIEKR